MDNKKNGIPKLRFPGFTGAWEQRKLGEVTEYIKGFAFKSKDYKKSGHRIIRVSDLGKDSIINNNDSIFVTDEISKQQNKYKINKNEIIITTVGSKAELKESAVGRPIIVRNSLGYLLNQNLVKIHGKNNKDSRFIYYQLLQPRYSQYIATIQRGNANQANIAISDLWNYRIFITKHNEQQKIGNFFQQLDSLIALHQRKLEHLQEQKKGLLQKMFPKNGEVVPEVRFPGFTDDWEQRKLGEVIVSEHKGKVKSSMKGGNTNYLETNYLNGGTAQKVDAIADVSKDDVLILWDGSKAGTIYHGFEGALGSTLKAYVPKYSGDFLYQILKKNQDKIYQSYRTPNIPHVIKNFTEKFNVSIPTIIEQQEIGDFFKQLDSLITLHQRKPEYTSKLT